MPDCEEYLDREIDIEGIFANSDGEREAEEAIAPLSIRELIMSEFKLRTKASSFFVLSNRGFHKVGYKDELKQLSIDEMDDRGLDGTPYGFRDRLYDTLRDTVLQRHLDDMHNGEQQEYFNAIARKINQFDDDFSPFDLVPVEFT